MFTVQVLYCRHKSMSSQENNSKSPHRSSVWRLPFTSKHLFKKKKKKKKKTTIVDLRAIGKLCVIRDSQL